MTAPAAPGNLATPVERLIAAVIDGAILFGGAIVLMIINKILGYIPVIGMIIGLVLSLAYLAVVIGYFIYLPAVANPYTGKGQTIGKKMRGIKIIKTDGSDLTVGDAVIRYIGYLVSCFVFGLGLIWILIDANKQGWHDKIAKTYVIKV